MNKNADNPVQQPPVIEVYVMPEYRRKHMQTGLEGTRKRAGKLLAEGIQFESDLAGRLALALTDADECSDF